MFTSHRDFTPLKMNLEIAPTKRPVRYNCVQITFTVYTPDANANDTNGSEALGKIFRIDKENI